MTLNHIRRKTDYTMEDYNKRIAAYVLREIEMSKQYEGIPGRVVLKVSAVYYPYNGIDTISDLFFGNSVEGVLDEIRGYLKHLEDNGKPYKRVDYKPKIKEINSENDEENSEDDEEAEENKEVIIKEKFVKPVFTTATGEPRAKGEALIGSVWMIHYGNKQKMRVPGNQESEYATKGFVRGGPRTKI